MPSESKVILCPYCGHTQRSAADSDTARCSHCGGLFEPLSRKATQIAMGPWYVRDKRAPFRPGCSFDILKKQIQAGRIKPSTVLRGPTTRQFWSVARNVPGVAHLLGYCHRCGAHIKPTDRKCGDCGERFIEPDERNELGLLFATQEEAAAAHRALEREIHERSGQPALGGASGADASVAAREATSATSRARNADPGAWLPQIGEGLLDEIIGGGSGADGAGRPADRSRSSAGRSAAATASRGAGAAVAPAAASTASTTASPRVKPPVVEALDFTPADAQEDDVNDEAMTVAADGSISTLTDAYAQRNRRLTLIIWILVGLNLVILPLLVVLVIYMTGGFGGTARGPGHDPTTAFQHQSGIFSSEADYPAAASPTTPTQPPADPGTAATASPQPEPATPAQPPVPVPTPSVEPPVTNSATPTQPATPVVTQGVQSAIRDAEAHEHAGRLNQALQLLEDVRGKTTPDQRPADFDAIVQRVKDKIARNEAADFFGIPLN